MKTLTVTARVEHGKLIIEAPAPADLLDGEHPALLQIDEAVRPRQHLILPTPWDWPADAATSTFGREEIYGDDGR